METRILLNILELLAFFASIYYYKNSRDQISYLLVAYLGFTVFVELVGYYPYFVQDGSFLSSLKGTLLEENYWLYNVQLVISILFYITYFKFCLRSKFMRLVLSICSVAFLLASILYFIFTDVFFVAFSPFTVIIGTLLIFLSIFLFYLELLNSNEILRVHRLLPFYISVAALVFHLCTTPLFIYSTYFSQSLNPEFYKLYLQVIFSTNFFMYSLYIIGFIVCARNKNSY